VLVLKTAFSLNKETLKLVPKENGIYDLRFNFEFKRPCEINVYIAATVKET
jgi:hypothetical protein